HNPWFARKLLESAHKVSEDAWATLDPTHPATASPLAPKFATTQTCALVCHVGVETRKIGLAGTRFDHATHVLKSGRDCDSCHSTAEHGKTLPAAKDCVSCHHGATAPKERACASCHADQDLFLRGVQEGGEQGPQMMAKVSCLECHGDAARDAATPPVRE